MAKAAKPTAKVMHYGTSKNFVVRDDQAVSAFVDLITENRIANGIYCLSLAHSVADGENPVEVDVKVRLRMTVDAMQRMHTAIGAQLEAARGPKYKPKAN